MCMHTCPEGSTEAILHLAYTLWCPCSPTTLLLFPKPRNKFYFRSAVSLKWSKILGCSEHCYRLPKPLQRKERWGQVFCGTDNILFTQLCWFCTPTRYLPWAVQFLLGLWARSGVLRSDGAFFGDFGLWVMWYLLALMTCSAADNSGTAQNILK